MYPLMLMVIDVGNTNIVVALYKKNQLQHSWRLATERRKTKYEYRIMFMEALKLKGFSIGEIQQVAISSVVPPVNPVLMDMFSYFWKIKAFLVRPGIKTGLNIKVDDPRGLGPDRIVNAVAAYHLYGGPCIIVDLGTATTVCAIDKDANFLGGVIAPGVGISVDALFAHAAKLPRIEINVPSQSIGKNTITSMQSGIFYGYVGMIEELITRIKEEIQSDALVVATGGFAEWIAQGTDIIQHIHPTLTLEGLRLLYAMNNPLKKEAT